MDTVEVYAEVGCPFTHVGLHRFVQRRRELGGGPTLHVRPWPLELVNGAPLDPAFIAEKIDELRRQVSPDLFVGFRPDAFPATSLPALALTAAAYEVGPSEGEQVALAVRDLLFEQGRAVDDPAVLAEVAAAVGVDVPDGHDAVLADYERGRQRGVIGSPHFFLPGGDFFCPSLDIARVDGHLRITADPTGFAAFLDACFA